MGRRGWGKGGGEATGKMTCGPSCFISAHFPHIFHDPVKWVQPLDGDLVLSKIVPGVYHLNTSGSSHY